MHDSVAHDFDYNDNGWTPLQGQQDEHPEAVNSAENAIEKDADKKYKTNYTKTHQSKLKTISPI